MARLLIVEDEFLLRELAVDEFTDAGFAVVQAASGDEALKILGGGEVFDVLFTDVRMPGTVDGWELGRRACEIVPGIRVIYATGYAEQSHTLSADEHFLPKPYRCDHVVQIMGDWGIAP